MTDAPEQEVAGVRLPVLVVLPAVAFMAVGLWVLWDATSTAKSMAFVATPQFALWWLLICVQGALWTLVLGFVWITVSRRVSELRGEGALTPRTLIAFGVAIAILVLLCFVPLSYLRGSYLGIVTVAPDQILLPSEFPLAHHRLKMNVITSIGVLLALLAIIGMFATALAFNRLQPSRPPSRGDLRRFLALRRELDALPAMTGLLIGMATLAAGGLRGAVLAANNQPYFEQHPNEHLEYAPLRSRVRAVFQRPAGVRVCAQFPDDACGWRTATRTSPSVARTRRPRVCRHGRTTQRARRRPADKSDGDIDVQGGSRDPHTARGQPCVACAPSDMSADDWPDGVTYVSESSALRSRKWTALMGAVDGRRSTH